MSAPHPPRLPSDPTSAEITRDLSRWRNNRDVLYDLFIRQDKTLKDLKGIMESDYGFPKTLK